MFLTEVLHHTLWSFVWYLPSGIRNVWNQFKLQKSFTLQGLKESVGVLCGGI